ncbi:MAG: hypothetical protein U0230_12775 [Polyangiales bacterium]
MRAAIRTAAWVAIASAMAVGCAESPVTVQLDFPALDYVRLSSTAQVSVFATSGGSRCADLVLMATESGVDASATATTPRKPLCQLRGGAAGVHDLRDGTYDFLVVTYAADGKAMFAGCTHATWDHGRPPVVVEVASPSDAALAALSGLPPATCPGLDDYCAGGCP